MNSQLRIYRSGMLTQAMTEQEVADLVATSDDYYVGDLVGRRPDFSGKLAGKTLTLRCDNNGSSFTHTFVDDHKLTWSQDGGESHEEYYEAFEIDEQVFMVAYLRKGSRPAVSITCANRHEDEPVYHHPLGNGRPKLPAQRKPDLLARRCRA